MAIKAIGTITENLNDGKRVRVDWKKVDPSREWYFYTHRGTVWRVLPGEWTTDGLIAFAFDGQAQDIDRYRNAPNWRERFGTAAPDKQRFKWTSFYEAVFMRSLVLLQELLETQHSLVTFFPKSPTPFRFILLKYAN
jgi:5-methylcytosine-specific restriction protein B